MNAILTTPAAIAAFATAVRTHLDDLPADDVDDLLDGLEADLSDQAADSGDAFALPDAAAYAAELRQAAGLPERVDGPGPRVPLRERAEGYRAALAGRIRTHSAGAWALDLLVSLRPVWWIVRGAALYVTVLTPAVIVLGATPFAATGGLGSTALSWIGLGAAVLLSVQWGRGRWLPARWTRALRTIVNAVTAVVAVVMLISAPTVFPRLVSQSSTVYVDDSQPGLVLDGTRVRNLFPYDAEGNPLTGVQLFDDQGRPVTTVGSEGIDQAWQWDLYFAGGGGPVTAPSAGTGTRPTWNVFPLLESSWDDGWGEPLPGSAEQPVPPFVQAPTVALLTGPTPTPTPVPTPGAAAVTEPEAAP
ncbi:hypothetical protein [Microbacterium sp. 18062]|uniref:hypothetical protein n=1 Tax=Microbacterium sp. 18062 TaxID=2681410 RepID=UPI00135676CE|nr:hypothetical protein [Microbacterium sp. 18062]